MESNTGLLALFEKCIWKFRYAAIVSVVVALIVSAIWFVKAIGKLCVTVASVFSRYGCSVVERQAAKIGEVDAKIECGGTLLVDSVQVIDAALMAAIFMIIAYGIYELFISEIDTDSAEEQRTKGKILQIKSIDELKSKLSKVIMLVLTVKVFALSVEMGDQLDTTDDLVNLALVIVLIAAAIFLSHSSIHIDFKKSDGGRKPLKSTILNRK